MELNKPHRNGLPERLRHGLERITDLSYSTLFVLWGLMVVLFAILYTKASYISGQGPAQIEGLNIFYRFSNSLYYSVITATSTGYGDITPSGISKIFASLQSMFSIFLFAIFVTKLVSRRQDIALQQIHKLSFEDVFHNIREGLFIVRKDFDHIITKASMQHALSEEDWNDLTTAYRQAQSFLRRILDFYDAQNRLYTIDERREELLHDGVKRTLKRIVHLTEILQSKHVNWTENNESIEELRELVQIIHHVLHFWHRQSPYHRNEAFAELFNLNDIIHKTIEKSVVHEG